MLQGSWGNITEENDYKDVKALTPLYITTLDI
jgi:hypothetical protein